MKRIVAFMICVMLFVVAYGQSIDKLNSGDQSKDVYAFVVVIKSTDKTTANIDFGDGSPIKVFADTNGKKRKFETPFEPINLLLKKGWCIDKFSSMVSGVNLITHWIMKKEVNAYTEAKEGLKLTDQ